MWKAVAGVELGEFGLKEEELPGWGVGDCWIQEWDSGVERRAEAF